MTARIGLVGCGRLAVLGYAPALRRASGVELVGVADPDHRRRAEVVAAAGNLRAGRVMAFPSAEALLAGTEVDALVLATPAPLHLADAERAVDAGVPVLVEKPPAADLDGARRLAALDPAPWVGLNRRFDPGLRAVRDATRAAAPDGDLVVPLAIHYRRQSWGAHQAHDDVLLDLGPHLVDLATWLTGARVEAVTAGDHTHDRATLVLHLDRGTAPISARADGLHREAASVCTTSGQVLGTHAVGGPFGAVRGRLARGPHPLVVSLTAQLEALGRALAGGDEPDLATAADGVAVMAVLDAARASASAGGDRVAVAPS